ncbi:MAG TPA: DUF892 family protein [Flavobacterium sp.]|nr:DUF892 family protein [Flavobacterium sp.]
MKDATPSKPHKAPLGLNEHMTAALQLPAVVHPATLRRALKSHFGTETGSMIVSVSDRTVTLEGLVDTWSQKELAGRTVWKAPGVSHVENNLKVRYEGRTPVSEHTFTMERQRTPLMFSMMPKPAANNERNAGLQGLFANALQDLYCTERFLVEALPRFIRDAADKGLTSFFKNYLNHVRHQLDRLNPILQEEGEAGKPVDYHPLSQLYQRTKDVINQTSRGPVMDLAMLSAVLKFNHFQMMAYGMLGVYAQTLDKPEVNALLNPSLEEKQRASESMIRLRSTIASGWIPS